MGDDEMAAIRAKRLAEMQAQAGGMNPGDMEKKAEQKRQASQQRNAMLSQVLSQAARARLNSIRCVKPEKAEGVENMLMSMARSGQINGRISEDQLKGLLGQVNQQMQKKKTTVQFRRRDFDDDDDDAGPAGSDSDSDDD